MKRQLNSRRITVFLVLLTLFVSHMPAQEEEQSTMPRVAILEVEGSGVSDDLLDLIKENLEEAFYNIDGFEIIERDQIALVFAEQEFQLSGLVNEDTAVEIGELLAADYVVTVSVTGLMEIILTVKVLNVQSGQVKYIETLSIRNQKDIQRQAENVAKGVEQVFFPSRFLPLQKVVLVSGQVALPVGGLSELVSVGFGGSAGFYLHNVFANFVDIGIEVSFQHYLGREKSSADWYRSIPVDLSVGYRFPVGSQFYIRPQVWMGVVFASANIDLDGFVYGLEDPEYEKVSSVYFHSALGATVGMERENFLLEASLKYTLIPGDSKLIMAIPLTISFGWIL